MRSKESRVTAPVEEIIRNSLHDKRVLVLGVGQRLRGDDGFGSLLAERLEPVFASRDDLMVIDCGTTPENNFAPAEEFRPDLTLFVDALRSEGDPGEATLIDPDEVALSGISTHTYSPAVFVERLLERAGGELKFVGVCPARTTPGEALSKACRKTLEQLVGLFESSVNYSRG